MTNKELAIPLQSLNMALGSLMQGETSYTNSFDCQVMEEGFLFFLVCQPDILLILTYIKRSS